MTVTDLDFGALSDSFAGQPQHVVDELIRLLGEYRVAWEKAAWSPYPWQVIHEEVPALGAWLMLGGRGTGKTEGAARYLDEHMRGPACDPRLKGGHRGIICAPTMGDAVVSAIQGPSGLQALDPLIKMRGGTGGLRCIWPNGSICQVMGAYTPEDIERARAAGNRCIVWLEEAAAMRHLGAVVEHLSLGLRLGSRPHFVISTTPKPRKEVKAWVNDPHTLVTKGTTVEAHHLDPAVRAMLFDRYGGTRLGRQELDAELLDDTEGALWTIGLIDAARITDFNPASFMEQAGLRTTRDDRAWRKIVAVDPPGETADCGIVVGTAPVRGAAGRDHAVILEDATIAGTPEVWGAQVVATAKRWGCERIVVEANQGGDMTRATIHNIDRTVRVDKVTAKLSKYDRAEPVSALYARGWVHHLGYFPELEDSLTTWVPSDSKSPDRLDALVHLVNALLKPMGPVQAVASSPLGRRLSSVAIPDRRR